MPVSIEIKQPESDEEFRQYFHLRWKILRAPWKQPAGSEVDDIEEQCLHIMAIDNSRSNPTPPVIGVARLQYNSDMQAQIRYMAVAAEYQKKGIGRTMLKQLEEIAQDACLSTIVLDAREPAVGFYQKLGYEVTDKSYILFDEIQHYRMLKPLTTVR